MALSNGKRGPILRNSMPCRVPWDKAGMHEVCKLLGKDLNHYQELGMEIDFNGKLGTKTCHFPSEGNAHVRVRELDYG